MSEYNANPIIRRFNELKSLYEKQSLEKTSFYKEDDIEEAELKETMMRITYIIKNKMVDLNDITDKIEKLSKYRKDIFEILIDSNKVQNKYLELALERATLITPDILLEKPDHIKTLLSGDLRGEPKIENDLDLVRMKNEIFLVDNKYIESLYDICQKIDGKIATEVSKLDNVTNFIEKYKKALNSFNIDKKVFNKYKCTICYEHEVTVCLMPCGHTFCRGCSEKVVKNCFACNSIVTNRNKIYLLGNEDDYEEFTPVVNIEPHYGFGANYA